MNVVKSFITEIRLTSKPWENKNSLDIFKKHISKISNIENFKMIGQILVSSNKNILVHYNVFCKYNQSQDELELLLNDVSKFVIEDEKLKFKSIILSKIAHEFKNPLVSITELVIQSLDDLDKIKLEQSNFKNNLKENFFQMKALSDFLLILIQDLNTFSESQLGFSHDLEKQEIRFNEVIDFCENITISLLRKANKQNQIKFIKNIDSSVPRFLNTNEVKLKQVIINLLSNAVKFTYYGEICLEVVRENYEYVKFIVRDSGTGISEEQKKKLFEPFQKGQFLDNDAGSGLGLSIVKDIITKLGGQISVKSDIFSGSEFSIILPIVSKQSNQKEFKNTILSSINNSDNFTDFFKKEEDSSSLINTIKLSEIVLDKNQILENNCFTNSIYCLNSNNIERISIPQILNNDSKEKSSEQENSEQRLKVYLNIFIL